MEVVELTHPLIEHKLAILRDKKTGTKEFRELVSELAMFLCYEAMSEAELEEVEIETPITSLKTKKLNEDKYAFVPILRAGMGMLEGITRVIPNAKIGHIGMYRNEKTFEPVNYYFKVPKGIENNIYQDICKRLEKKEVNIIVDAAGELLVKTLEYQPFLIKPNREELGEIFGVTISSREEAVIYAKTLQSRGAKNVLVSMGSMGAVLVDENGYSYKRRALNRKKRINTVGAGDSMVAGFIAGYELFHNYEKALQLGMAAGTATANSMFLASKEEIDQLFQINCL